MKKKLQVFVSSTFVDMLPERQAAVEAILRAGHIPAGMELFAASDESQLETIRRWIEDSDIFLLILGGRYGSIEPKSGKSYIELEYEHAQKKRKPLFAAVIHDTYLSAKVKTNGPDAMERDNGHLLKAFRATVTSKICRFFSDTNELKLIVFESLANLERNEGLAGWIHGSDVVDPKATLEQLSRLQEENESLRLRNAELEGIIARIPQSGQGLSAGSLSDDAKELLVAAKNGGGQIMYLRSLRGTSLQAADRNFINPQTDREEARWKAALDELVDHRLVEGKGSRGETFRMTDRGYKVADELESGVVNPASRALELSRDAVVLLQTACKDDGTNKGIIVASVTRGGLYVQTGAFTPGKDDDVREAARWRHALNELTGLGLIEPSDGGELFTVTHIGWNAFDKLGPPPPGDPFEPAPPAAEPEGPAHQ